MHIRQRFAPGRHVFSFEFFPPKTDAGAANLERTVTELADLSPAFVSVTYGAGGSTRERTIDLVSRIQRGAGITTMAHLTCVGAGRAELASVVDRLLDNGVVNVLPSRRSGAVVDAMLHDPRVRIVSFTGSTEVGRKLLHAAADNVLNTAMELGGNAPFIVFEDADVDAAIEGAMIAKMRNMGEACTAANRFYVHESVHDEFAKKLTGKMQSLKMGNGLDDGINLGPLVNKEGRDKVIELVDDAAAKGAKVLTGGKTPDGPGFFYPATVLTNVPDSAKMLNEEIFGPVASIQTFKTEDEVIKRANDEKAAQEAASH